jgi:hypothetical protein
MPALLCGKFLAGDPVMPQPNHLRPLGRIVRLQIQRSPLKVGEKPNRRYDPWAILSVDTLTLTPTGAIARLADGTELLDVHNAAHPQTRNNNNVNPLSIGFTSHYAAMRERFGEKVVLGCAGENIIVETERLVELPEVERGIVIQAAYHSSLVALARVTVAAPCKPFTGYLLDKMVDAATLKSSLQFLDNGLRGYYLALAQVHPVSIAVGDQVFAVE